jgi:hypothetical protein
MSRDEALEIAKANYASHMAANIAKLFKNGHDFDALADFGYRHGWYRVGESSFSHDEVTGETYDPTQAGWAYL